MLYKVEKWPPAPLQEKLAATEKNEIQVVVFGRPGSGKSFVAQQIANMFDSNGFDVVIEDELDPLVFYDRNATEWTSMVQRALLEKKTKVSVSISYIQRKVGP